MITLAHPALLLVGGLLLLPYVWRRRRAWQYSCVQLLPSNQGLGGALWVRLGVTSSAVLLLLIALARPQNTVTHATQTLEVRDIVLTLDLSLSMEGTMPTQATLPLRLRKLDVLQRAALSFVKRRAGDRLGLMVFGDEAFGVWPLSADSTTLQQRLQRLDRLIPDQLRGTRVANALYKSLDHLQELGQATTQIVLLLTDGLDTITPEDVAQLLQRLQRQQVTLYVLGIQLPKDASVAHLTRQAQGKYFDIAKAEDLDSALQEIDQRETTRVRVARDTEVQELYRLFAFPGLVCLVASMACAALWVLEI